VAAEGEGESFGNPHRNLQILLLNPKLCIFRVKLAQG
jgi:hypothetical protein